MAVNGGTTHYHAVIGNDKNFWTYDSRSGFDLTRSNSPTPNPSHVTIQTTTSPITIDPAKTALIIIDMQNYFLSPALGRERGPGHAALDQLVQHAIPAARAAGIRILWLNWGLAPEEISAMPPAVSRAFGFVATDSDGAQVPLDKHGDPGDKETLETGKAKKRYGGMGSEMGSLTDPATGKQFDAGRLLMRSQWNSALIPPLDGIYTTGSSLPSRPDVWIHKNRMSGLWGPSTPCSDFLEQEGITTLLFAGVNTDQCVGGTYQDAFSKGYDCVLLRDGCGTTTPGFAKEMVEWNAANTWGFVCRCEDLARGVEGMKG